MPKAAGLFVPGCPERVPLASPCAPTPDAETMRKNYQGKRHHWVPSSYVPSPSPAEAYDVNDGWGQGLESASCPPTRLELESSATSPKGPAPSVPDVSAPKQPAPVQQPQQKPASKPVSIYDDGMYWKLLGFVCCLCMYVMLECLLPAYTWVGQISQVTW